MRLYCFYTEIKFFTQCAKNTVFVVIKKIGAVQKRQLLIFMLPRNLCWFGSLRKVVLVWFSQESCAGLGSLRKVVLIWVLSGKLCWFEFSQESWW